LTPKNKFQDEVMDKHQKKLEEQLLIESLIENYEAQPQGWCDEVDEI